MRLAMTILGGLCAVAALATGIYALATGGRATLPILLVLLGVTLVRLGRRQP